MSAETRSRSINNMLFEYATTMRTDYPTVQLTEPVETKYQKKPTCYRGRPPPLKYIHTLTNWKADPIPFDLLHGKRDIIRTDPRTVQQPYSKPPDPDLEETQKTRPRLVMTPAVSMDDIKDKNARRLLIEDMYTSDMTRSNREAEAEYLCVKAPLPDQPAPANPIFLPKVQAAFVSPEWRMETVSWDKKQLRCHCDVTAEFWLRRNLSHCSACKETAIVKRQRAMKATVPR